MIVALTRAFPDYGEHGLRHLPASPTIYLTGEAHHSFNKIAHMTGLGRQALRTVATDRDLKMDIGRSGKASGRGSQERVRSLHGGRHRRNHGGRRDRSVAGAWRASAGRRTCGFTSMRRGAAPPSSRRVSGIIWLESTTRIRSPATRTNGSPCRWEPECSSAATPTPSPRPFARRLPTCPGKQPGRSLDPYTTSVQWSRRFIGLKLFLALAQHGESGYAEMIEHQTRMGDVLRESLKRAGWRIVNSTPLPLVCFTRDGLDTAKFLAALHERQIAWMSEVRLGDGAPVVRACITSFRTTEADIQWVVSEMSRLIMRLPTITDDEKRNDRHPRRLRSRSNDEGRGCSDLSDGRVCVRQRRSCGGAVQSRSRRISLHPHQQPDHRGAGAARRRARGRTGGVVREHRAGGDVITRC